MAQTRTFLQLPMELGGLRYGPFDAQVVLGSDPKRAQIVLDPSHGVFPLHVTVSLLQDGSYSIVPGTKDCKVFVAPNGQPHSRVASPRPPNLRCHDISLHVNTNCRSAEKVR